MKIDHQDEINIGAKILFEKISNDFQDIEDVCITINKKGLDEWGNNIIFSKINDIYPLRISVIHSGKVSRYRFNEKNECDDEFALTYNNNTTINYWDFKKYVKENCPILFKSKTYLENNIIHFDNIDTLLNLTNKKISVLNLTQELENGKQYTQKRNKI